MSAYYISKERFWVLVTGGYNEYNQFNGTSRPITGSNILEIIDLGMIINIHNYHVIY